MKSVAWTVVGIHRIAQADNKVRGLRIDDAIASRVGGGHSKADQLSVGEGILLRGACDGYAPVMSMK